MVLAGATGHHACAVIQSRRCEHSPCGRSREAVRTTAVKFAIPAIRLGNPLSPLIRADSGATQQDLPTHAARLPGSGLCLALGEGADQVAVEPRNGLEWYALRADRSALADIGTAAEALGIVLGDHAEHPGVSLRLALRQQAEVSHLCSGVQHRRTIGTGRDAGSAGNTGCSVERG